MDMDMGMDRTYARFGGTYWTLLSEQIACMSDKMSDQSWK